MIEDLKDQKVEDVTLGSNTSFCLLRNGKAMGWGASKFGKLGVEAALDRNFA
jgi:alpha-tubulin suppressor-like RCC1 family protein